MELQLRIESWAGENRNSLPTFQMNAWDSRDWGHWTWWSFANSLHSFRVHKTTIIWLSHWWVCKETMPWLSGKSIFEKDGFYWEEYVIFWFELQFLVRLAWVCHPWVLSPSRYSNQTGLPALHAGGAWNMVTTPQNWLLVSGQAVFASTASWPSQGNGMLLHFDCQILQLISYRNIDDASGQIYPNLVEALLKRSSLGVAQMSISGTG